MHLRLPFAPPSRRAALTSDGRCTVKAKRASLYNSLEKVAAERGDADCFWSRDRGCYSWRQMWDRVNQYAQFWLSRGVQKGDLVALYMVNSPDFPLAWIGLWAVGAAPAMINYSLAGKALLHCMGISTARLMLVDGDEAARKRIEDVRDRLEGVEIMYLEDVKAEIESMPPERPPDELREHITLNSPMSLLYTSGTTGFPKACILPMAAGFNQALLREVGGIKVDPKERFYNCMPYYHGTGGILLMGSLLVGKSSTRPRHHHLGG